MFKIKKQQKKEKYNFDNFESEQIKLFFNCAFLLFNYIWCDIWFRVLVHQSFSLSGIVYNILFTLSFICVLYFILSFFKKCRNSILLAVTFISVIFYCSQYIYHSFFQKLYTWFSVMNGGEVVQFSDLIVRRVLVNIPVLLLFLAPSILFLLRKLVLKKVNIERILGFLHNGLKSSQNSLNCTKQILSRVYSALLALTIFSITLFIIFIGSHKINSAYDLYFVNNDPLVASEKIGLLPAMSVDLRQFVFPSSMKLTKINHSFLNKYSIANSRKKNETLTNQEISVSPEKIQNKEGNHSEPEIKEIKNETGNDTETGTETVIENQVNGDNVLDIDFDKIMAKETNPQLMEMHQYFNNVKATPKNEHTGMFEGYNLIFITAEAFCSYAIDKDLTPTLYHMQENGMKFTNFYNPIWGGSTTDGEYTGISGLAPKPGVWSMVESSKKYMPFVPGNMSKLFGYNTSAYHNGEYQYYDRHISHPNLGYNEYFGIGNGYENMVGHDANLFSDLSLFKGTLDNATKTEPFHSYYMTFSGHMPFDFTNGFYQLNVDKVNHLNASESVISYLGAQYELEKGMNYLLNYLREKGIADRTLIVLNGDHYPYDLTKEEYDELAGHELEEYFEMYKNSLIIYSDGMKAETIDKPCFTLDIMPTLMNLMGFPYDSRLFAGRDIFANYEPLVFFGNRSWITDKGKFNSLTGEFIPNDNLNEEEIDNYYNSVQMEVIKRYDYSIGILDYDYYRLVVNDEMLKEAGEKSFYKEGWYKTFKSNHE